MESHYLATDTTSWTGIKNKHKGEIFKDLIYTIIDASKMERPVPAQSFIKDPSRKT